MKKRSFTLVETLICFSLLSLLLLSLIFWIRFVSTEKAHLATLHARVMEESFAAQRVRSFFAEANVRPLFKATPKDVAFTFDFGLQKEPLLCGNVVGHLYLDHAKHALSLHLSSHPDRAPLKMERTLVLLDRVDDLSFRYYCAPQKKEKVVDPKEVGHPHPEELWQNSWSQEYNVLPAMVEITLMRSGALLKWVVDCPLSPCKMVYHCEVL